MLANVPHAQLPDTISPKNYRIDMMIDPQDEGMSGTVAIDVTMNDATDKIWLHAKEMTVSAARIDYKDGTSTELKFHAIPLKDAPSGIAYLRAGKTLPAGDGTITIEYTTPYNQNLNSAYQVRRGDEAYIVTPEVSVSSVTIEGEPWTKHQFAKTRPLPTYLIAFAVGPYDIADYGEIAPNSIRKTPLKLRGLTAAGKSERVEYALAGTEPILTALEWRTRARLYIASFFYCWMRIRRSPKSGLIIASIVMSSRINGLAI